MFSRYWNYFIPLVFIIICCSPKTAEVVRKEVKGSAKITDDPFSKTEIHWDKWGVPHIYAKNNVELFYSFGWAQMHSHANTILKLYGHSRGRAAEYWGPKKLENDLLIHSLGFPELGVDWYEQQSDEFKSYIDSFVKGMNDYVSVHPKAIDKEFKNILPVENYDVLKHALFVVYSRFVGGQDLQKVGNWERPGSNTYAIGPSRSASGKAMLVMNPHLPWSNEFLFYEGHFNTPDLNLYGAALVGLPTLGIAFNEYLGWSHTNNTIDNADLYELSLKGDSYLVDGELKPLIRREIELKVKQENGRIAGKKVPLYRTIEHGAILRRKDDKALAIKMPGFNRPFGIVQWWEMGNAKSLDEFKSSLQRVQIPFFNVMYADKAGNIFYMFNGQVPIRKRGGWDFWNGIVDGSKSENLWTDVHTYEELPKIENPKSGFLQNANDPPWTSTFPPALNPKDFPPYMSPISMAFRPQQAVQMMVADESISFDELVSYKMSTEVEMAQRLLDDLFDAIDRYGGDESKQAKIVLSKWDRNADSQSKGMALFYEWARQMGPNNPAIYKTPWSLENAITTPDGLAEPEKAVRMLEVVVKDFQKKGLPLDLPWGMVYRIRYNDKDLPGNGADGSVGIFRVATSNGKENDGTYHISGGDSWQAVIEFDDKVKAKVLLSYGQSTQKGSPNYGDQLDLFSRKELRECDFYRQDVIENSVRKEILLDGKFIPRHLDR